MKQRRLRVLICDTDAEILINLEQMLENAGLTQLRFGRQWISRDCLNGTR